MTKYRPKDYVNFADSLMWINDGHHGALFGDPDFKKYLISHGYITATLNPDTEEGPETLLALTLKGLWYVHVALMYKRKRIVAIMK